MLRSLYFKLANIMLHRHRMIICKFSCE